MDPTIYAAKLARARKRLTDAASSLAAEYALSGLGTRIEQAYKLNNRELRLLFVTEATADLLEVIAGRSVAPSEQSIAEPQWAGLEKVHTPDFPTPVIATEYEISSAVAKETGIFPPPKAKKLPKAKKEKKK